MSSAPSVRTAAIWGMAGQYVVFAAQFATSVIISRFFLTPGEVGLFGTALAAAMMVAVFQDFGIGRYVSGEPDLDDAKIRRVFSVSVVIALTVGLVVLALAWPIARFYGDDRLFPILAVIAGSYLLVPFGIVPAALLQRNLDFRSLFAVNTGAAFAMAVTTIAMAANGWSAMALALGTIAQAAARALIGIRLSGARMHLANIPTPASRWATRATRLLCFDAAAANSRPSSPRSKRRRRWPGSGESFRSRLCRG